MILMIPVQWKLTLPSILTFNLIIYYWQSEAGRKPGSAVAVSAEFDEGEEPMYTDKNVSIDPTLTLIPADDPDKSKLYCTSCRLSLVSEDVRIYRYINDMKLK